MSLIEVYWWNNPISKRYLANDFISIDTEIFFNLRLLINR